MKYIDFLLKHSNAKSLFLDAGINDIELAYDLHDKGFKGKYFGVDSDFKKLKRIKNLNRDLKFAKHFKMAVEKMNFKDCYFDFVLVKNLIEHRQYYSKSLIELARVTGKFLILEMEIKPLLFLPDKISKDKDGIYSNRYNLQKLFVFLKKHRLINPKKLFEDWNSVVFVFEKKS